MTSKAARIACAAMCAVVVCGTPALAEQAKIDGTFKSDIVQQVVTPTGGADGKVVAEVAKGKAALPGNPLDGAAVFMNETVILDNGTGPQHGVIVMTTDKGSLTSSYWGAVKTEMVDGKPRITTSGDWKTIAGTGMYAKANGKGTYSGAFASKTAIEGAYKGTLTVP